MKKVLVFLFVTCGAWFSLSTAHAQDVEKKNQWAVEAGVGGNGDIGVNLGVRWQHNFHPYVTWDVLSANFISNVKCISDAIMPQIMTGIRLHSPEFAGMKVYAIGHIGYGGVVANDDSKGNGLGYEVGGGLCLTKHLYVGYAYNFQDIGTEESGSGKYKVTVERKAKFHSFRIGWVF